MITNSHSHTRCCLCSDLSHSLFIYRCVDSAYGPCAVVFGINTRVASLCKSLRFINTGFSLLGLLVARICVLPRTSPLSPPVNQLSLPETQVVPSERFRTCTTSPWGLPTNIGYPDQRCPAPRVPLAEVRPDNHTKQSQPSAVRNEAAVLQITSVGLGCRVEDQGPAML